jgi:hypothetical protein
MVWTDPDDGEKYDYYVTLTFNKGNWELTSAIDAEDIPILPGLIDIYFPERDEDGRVITDEPVRGTYTVSGNTIIMTDSEDGSKGSAVVTGNTLVLSFPPDVAEEGLPESMTLRKAP